MLEEASPLQAIRLPELESVEFDLSLAEGFVFEPLAWWAKKLPNQLALISPGFQLSYAELEARTNQLARVLRERGVQRGQRVAFVLPRGPEAVLLLIAILKSGAAYVPLASEAPMSRTHDCLEDANPALVVTDALSTFTGTLAEWPLLPLDALIREADRASSLALDADEIGLRGEDLAYVIFTSGSTGRPKGVPISHASLSNFVVGDQLACIRVEPWDQVLQAFSPASDGHHEEIWPTLRAGATLVVATFREVHSGPELGEFLNRHGVTIISCAPTLLSMVTEDVPTLRRILFGAESLPPALVRRWWRPGREILNTYGPTEATVGATFSYCEPNQPVTIGQALPNYCCYVVDESLQELPDGEEGELAIAGIGVSSGYFQRPELNAGRFVPNPHARPELRNEVLYRTGDRVRRREDGNLVWLGRLDAQFKIRGHRIEPSEIESHLLAFPGVNSAAVVVRAGEDQSPRLVALLVVQNEEQFDLATLTAELRETLPGYMVPQLFERVERIPALPSGKIDRKACEQLSGHAFRIEREILPPRTDTERLVLEAWEELFPDPQLSCTDDFFRDLGGDSLLASSFVSKMRSVPGQPQVSVLALYENPTIRSFAAMLDRHVRPETVAPEFATVPPARYAIARAWQGLGLLVLFGIEGLFWLGPVIAAIYFSDRGLDDFPSLLLGLGVHALSVPLLLLLGVVVKWTVGGKFQAGTYPLWSSTFLRWWFVQRILANSPVGAITGTPLAPLYLRLLGAKVGKNVTFESLEFDCPDLIEIGDNCNFENSSWLHAAEVVRGELHLRPIRVGKGCSVGVRAGLAGGAVLEEGTSLRDLTCVVTGETVPKNEEWAGSPARRVEKREQPIYDPTRQPDPRRRALFGVVQCLLAVVLTVLESVPFVTVAFVLYNRSDSWTDYLWQPFYAIALVLLACVQALVVKWLVLGRLKPGTYPHPGGLWLRKWFCDRHLDLLSGILVPVYDSLFARPWCQALGMKCGPRCEIAIPRRMPYDLVEMGEESFLASEVSIGRPIRGNGQVTYEKTTVAPRSFLGNDSVIPQGVQIPGDFLLGVLSVCPSNEQIGSDGQEQAWLGSPPFRLPNRKPAAPFDVTQTYRPTYKMYAQRLGHEALRVVLPSLCSLVIFSLLIEGFVAIWNEWSLPVALLLLPVLYLAGAMLATVVCRISKAVFVGRYETTVQPLWSPYVWKSETHSAVVHDFGGPIFIHSLIGTPFLATFMRFMGAKVGERAFINSTDWTETDLIHLGDDVAINANAPLQAHLFEDRVMKVGAIRIGDRCTVGNYSVILCESELKADAYVGHTSLVMKGETIPAGTCWAGSPAQAVERDSQPPTWLPTS